MTEWPYNSPQTNRRPEGRTHLGTVLIVVKLQCGQRLSFSRPAAGVSPSPWGEGRGEGERSSNFCGNIT
jgi:hypothetical protein